MNTHKIFPYLAISFLFIYVSINQARADGVQQYIQSNCIACHAMKKPDFEGLGIEERINRKGPHLYYAGDKFNSDWLQAWLEEPYRIRPGGSFPPDHTIVTDEGDVINKESLLEHISIPKEMSKGVAEYLLSLKLEKTPTLEKEYTEKQVSPVMGKMDFHKFKGCAACHGDSPGIGGVSGPELYTAWARLNQNYFISYIKNPTAWDPHSMMPNKHLNEEDIHKLVDYLRQVGE